ncbi:MAG TPA: dihydrolipoamide acetyltransferase family protein [Solirubrobacteraceae bacterium]|jgi:pyruvate dehydrogenase E2 component (dihydrolipoamide acetyltransferase)|nr:dihydrolipoamide acetyltransferase family protein [Solirubrobacteraceae bacterium]
MTEITMPRLSDSMEEATIIKWLKRDGERVEADEELVEVETDKATVTVSAEEAGVLSIVAAEGTTAAIGEVIARMAAASEDLGVAPEIADAEPAQPVAVAAPAADVRAAPANGTATGNGHPPATPLARRAARLHGVELAALTGTGPRGLITRDDVLQAAGHDTPAPATTAPPPLSVDGNDAAATHRLTRLQQLIARRMTESRSTIPEFEVETEVAMDEVVALRERMRDGLGDDRPVPSLNDLLVRACALTLRRHSRLNASYREAELRVWPDINIGVAVATDDALIVPTLRNADTLSLGQIARETRRLADRVRTGRISPAELEGGTFTVSNLGMYGMTAIRPVINPPQVAILGVGAVRDTLARGDGEIVDRKLMTLTLSADHRAVYGADAARFLADLRELLQAPLGILL